MLNMKDLDNFMGITEMIIYLSVDGKTKIGVRMEAETVWLTIVAEGRYIFNYKAKYQFAHKQYLS